MPTVTKPPVIERKISQYPEINVVAKPMPLLKSQSEAVLRIASIANLKKKNIHRLRDSCQDENKSNADLDAQASCNETDKL